MKGASVVQVFLDDHAGGPMHVRLIEQALKDDIEISELAIPPNALRSIRGWTRWARRISDAPGTSQTILHAQGIRAAAACLWARYRHHRTLVITIQGLHSFRRSPNAAVRWLNRRVLRSASLVLCTGNSDRETILGERLARPESVRHIRTSFEERALPPRSEARQHLELSQQALVFLWLGRFSREKDPGTFARAVGLAIEAEGGAERIVGLMVGDGAEFDAARDAASTASWRNHMVFTGWLDDPAEAIAAADVYVSTSVWEGMPHAPMEAGAAGLPLVLSDVPGNRDIARAGVPAILVPQGDARALADEMRTLAGDIGRINATGARTAAAVRTAFAIDGLRTDLGAAYRDALNSGPAAANQQRPLR